MTIVDLFLSLNGWLRFVVYAIAIVWLLETLLLPFKLNLMFNTMKRIEGLLETLVTRIEINKSIESDYKKMVSLLNAIGNKSKDKKED